MSDKKDREIDCLKSKNRYLTAVLKKREKALCAIEKKAIALLKFIERNN